jgi:hypothetical protein
MIMIMIIGHTKKLGLRFLLSLAFLVWSAKSMAEDYFASVYWAGSKGHIVDSKFLNVFFFKDGKAWKGFEPKQGLFNKRAADGVTFLYTGPKNQAAKEFQWTMFFDGKKLGQVTTKWVKSFENSSSPKIHHIIKVEPKSQLPKRWILLSSRSDINDPQEWKVSKDDSEARELAQEKFRQLYPEEYKCLDSEAGYGGSEKTGKPLKTSELQIQKTYKSNNGQFLVGVRKKTKCAEDHYSTSNHWLLNWILVDKDKKAKLLNVGGEVVDAADLDRDGFSEWIFVTTNYADFPYFSLVSLQPVSEAGCCSDYSEP